MTPYQITSFHFQLLSLPKLLALLLTCSIISRCILKHQFHFWSAWDVNLLYLLVTFLNRHFCAICHSWEKTFIDIFKLTPLFSLNFLNTMTHPKLNNDLIAGALRIKYCLSCCKVPFSMRVHVLYLDCNIQAVIQGRKPHVP